MARGPFGDSYSQHPQSYWCNREMEKGWFHSYIGPPIHSSPPHPSIHLPHIHSLIHTSKLKAAQSYLTFCDPTDCSLPGSYLWDSPGKNTQVSCHSLLQGIFPNQGSNLGLLIHSSTHPSSSHHLLTPYPPTYPSIYPSNHPLIHLSTHPYPPPSLFSIHPLPIVQSLIHPSTHHPSIHPPIHLSIHP